MAEGSTEVVNTRQLIVRILEQDETALSDLARYCVDRVLPNLESRYYGVLDDSELAGVMNAVVHNVWRWAANFDPAKGDFDGWLYTIARNEVVSYLRREPTNETLSPELAPPAWVRRPDDTSITDSPEVKRLLTFIDQLPRLQKAVIQADLAADGKADDQRLAEKYGTSVNSIRSTRCAARKKLRDAMETANQAGQQEQSGH